MIQRDQENGEEVKLKLRMTKKQPKHRILKEHTVSAVSRMDNLVSSIIGGLR